MDLAHYIKTLGGWKRGTPEKAFSILFFFLACAQSTYAQSPQIKPFISVYPVIFNISLTPGKSSRHVVKVKNLTDTPLPLHADLESFSLADEDFGARLPPTLTTWSRLDNSDMILDPGEEKEAVIRIDLPRRIPLGGYYATLNLEPKILQKDSQINAIVQSRINVLFLGSIGVPRIDERVGRIESLTSPVTSSKTTIPLSFTVKNTSLYHFSAKPILKISPLLGELKEIDIEEKIVLPGRGRRWDISYMLLRPRYGIYSIQLQVSVGNGIKIIEKQVLIVFPFMQIVGGTVSVVGIFLLFKKRSQIKKALTILFARNS